ncbi:hypothetical protein [Bosea sp. TND4EK4]|uniref:hypothetical protein n=1 Tax=Bosea sp. TND4EK4 TaxID=1907408 RepID=UPI0009565571|nr:hypothetical protein [Bosea sp. TND4EK4]SIQ03002.1 hypothetical protein SAMN05880592_101626 [Bosea sp. TND4EK4]
MSDARSLTPLSQADYEAIEAAVMETARGRWFMAEYAKRNRQADTQQLLTAIGRIERVVGLGVQETSREDNLLDAAALIHDLRSDLERISGRSEDRASGLAAQIEQAAGTVTMATESIQEVAWTLREAGAEELLCDTLDHRTTEIAGAIAIIDGLSQRVDKIADTIAMLDTSLRAFGEVSYTSSSTFFDLDDLTVRKAPSVGMPEIAPLPVVAVAPLRTAAEPEETTEGSAPEERMATIEFLDDDLVLVEPAAGVPAGPPVSPRQSEIGLAEIDAMPADRKLAYFA